MIKLIRLDDRAVLPERSTRGSVGYDLTAIGDYQITDEKPVLVRTGWRLGAPLAPTQELQIRPRSSLFKNWGLIIPNSPGTVDQDYTGEIMVQVVRVLSGVTNLPSGTRIAQLIVGLVDLPNFVQIQNPEFETERDGFGSTGL